VQVPDVERLHALRAGAAARLTQRVADGDAPLAELRELQERLRLVDAALAEGVAPRTRRWQVVLWPVLVVATLASLAAAIPVPSVPFALELQARAVSLQLDAAGELGSQPIDGELRVEGFTRLESPAAALARLAAESSPDRIAVSAPHLSLRRVVYPPASVLHVEAGPQVHLSLHAARSPVVVEIEFAGATSWHFGDAASRRSNKHPHAEWVRLIAGDAAAPARRPPPLDLWLARAEGRSYAWSGLRPVALQFVERRAAADAEAVVASSLEQARITLPATGAEVRLAGGDRLEIAGLELERFELVAGDSVGVKLSGSARTMTTRTGDFERSLKPSLLEYVARHHTIGLFWSAALLLWGILGWLRKQLDAGKP